MMLPIYLSLGMRYTLVEPSAWPQSRFASIDDGKCSVAMDLQATKVALNHKDEMDLEDPYV